MREMHAKVVVFIILCFAGHTHFSVGQLHSNYFVDDYSGIWTKFDGIGAISGGGATSKLLINYPEPHRSYILDYLFKPKFAASLQMLKVEIGGDSQSSDGSESSHMHTADDENYSRGYQWWLMTEAKKRNPDIKLYGLPWTFPGWVGGGVFDPFYNRTATVRYIMNWINGAWQFHGLKINYIGVWNERNCDQEYVKLLRSALDTAGHSDIQIVAPDAQSWDILKAFASDPDFLNSVNIVGQHYPGAGSPDAALRLDKMLWASEEYSTFNDIHGGGCWARVLVESPVHGFYSGIIAWNLIASYYDRMPYSRDGLMTANEPWSGHYEVSSPIWMSAHHAQFYSPGWFYLRHGRGLGSLLGNGSYVSLTTADRQHLTIVIQTLNPVDAPCSYFMPKFPVAEEQFATFTLRGSFSSIQKLYVWYSYLDFTGNSSVFFQQQSPVLVVDGNFTLRLRANEIYTLTTVADGNKGSHGVPPNSSAFPVPYVETFENYSVGSEPFNLAQQCGSFEVTSISRAAGDDDADMQGNKAMTQVVTQPPVDTCTPERMPRPLALIGDFQWTNVSVEIDVLLNKTYDGTHAHGVFLASNVNIGGCWSMYANGVYLWVSVDSQRARLTGNQTGTVQYNEVDLPSIQYGRWFTIGLDVLGSEVMATFDHKTIMFVNIPFLSSTNGFVAVGPDRFGVASFDNLRISRADRSQATKTVLPEDHRLKFVSGTKTNDEKNAL